uniref:Uncharacterized protein n=1 Tax=Romanomermis culicivorax TaxID=13658 RepID=A0A915JAI3_ROMCU
MAREKERERRSRRALSELSWKQKWKMRTVSRRLSPKMKETSKTLICFPLIEQLFVAMIGYRLLNNKFVANHLLAVLRSSTRNYKITVVTPLQLNIQSNRSYSSDVTPSKATGKSQYTYIPDAPDVEGRILYSLLGGALTFLVVFGYFVTIKATIGFDLTLLLKSYHFGVVIHAWVDDTLWLKITGKYDRKFIAPTYYSTEGRPKSSCWLQIFVFITFSRSLHQTV